MIHLFPDGHAAFQYVESVMTPHKIIMVFGSTYLTNFVFNFNGKYYVCNTYCLSATRNKYYRNKHLTPLGDPPHLICGNAKH